MDLVSVIIPVYNVRDYLERCLKSVLSQTYENLEVIVVDNGSTDGSGEICDAFASEDSRVKVIHLENPDVSWARNAGLDSASGDWIMFVDSDDFIHRQAVELLLSAVGGENDIVMGDFRRVNDADVDVDEITLEHDVASVQKSIITGRGALDSMYTLPDGSNLRYLVIWNRLYPASLLKDLRFQNIYGIEDQPFNVALYQKVRNVIRLRVTSYFYYLRKGSITYENSCEKWSLQVRGFMEMLSLIPVEETDIRGHLLKKLYNKMLTSRYFLRGTEFAESAKDYSRKCFRETRREYFSSSVIQLKDKAIFILFWSFPFILHFIMYYTGNRQPGS